VGSIPAGVHGRVTIDFNAPVDKNPIGTDAYDMYQKAKRPHTDPEWNGYTPIFFSVDDYPTHYTAEFLKEQERDLGDKFRAVYPRNDEEMWIQSAAAVFNWDHLQACVGVRYLQDALKREEYIGCEFFHGVDTATGSETGDWAVMTSWALKEGVLCEVAPPIRERLPEDVFARMVDTRAREFPGVVVRNWGPRGSTVTETR
jgi:hypothetical protein